MTIHDQNFEMMKRIFRADAIKTRECHSCGERHPHVVLMFNPDDPEARGEYGPCCIQQKRKDGWRVV